MAKISKTHHVTKNGKIKKNPKKKKPGYPSTVKSKYDFLHHKLALVTPDYVFYIDENESDEDASVMMFDRDMNLISDNYFAFSGLLEAVDEHYPDKSYVWASSSMKNNMKGMYQGGNS